MQLLTTTRVYDSENDQMDVYFMSLVNSPPSGFLVLDGNAGLGADWPAGIWKSVQGIAVALSIISAPSTIKENWPLWKSIFEELTQKVIEIHGEYRIDRDTAHVIAIHHAVFQENLRSDRLSVHMAIRHYFSSVAGYEDLLITDRLIMDWPDGEYGTEAFSQGVRSNEEAAKQARCRYIFGIEDGYNCLTLIIEQDGTISGAKKLNMDSSWG